MTDITRRQFTSICAASLAVPGMLPTEVPVKATLKNNELTQIGYDELIQQDYRQYFHSLGEPWFIINDHEKKTGTWLTGILYKSPCHLVIDIPYEDGFFVREKEQLVWAWGELILQRNVLLTRHQKGWKDGTLANEKEEISACLHTLNVKNFFQTGSPPEPFNDRSHPVHFKHLRKNTLEGIDLK